MRITITIAIDEGDGEPAAPSDQVETGATVIHVEQPRYVGFAPDAPPTDGQL